MKYATIGCFTNAVLCAIASMAQAQDSIGQVMFIFGLIIVGIGVVRSLELLEH